MPELPQLIQPQPGEKGRRMRVKKKKWMMREEERRRRRRWTVLALEHGLSRSLSK